MTQETLEALRTRRVTQKFVLSEFTSPVPGLDITLFRSTGDLFDPDRTQYLRVIARQRDQSLYRDAITEIVDWMGLNNLRYRPHRTRWGMLWFDIHLSEDQLFDFRMRWG